MLRLKPIHVDDARLLLDFGRSQAAAALAEKQLEGAVAAHNSLARSGLAYVADEVGMGKTYVALGVAGLLRHFHPAARILVIAPRENIQRKWIKELGNFVRDNWKVRDLRVRSLQDTPARAPVLCGSLEDFARQAVRNPERDFFLRLSSFSLSMSDGDRASWRDKWDGLVQVAPWLEDRRPDGRASKEDYKDAYARALNALLPSFDLVIVDEGHNLKAGLGHGVAARNRLLSLVLGTDPEATGLVRRAGNVLLLSATPFETDYAQLWNQLHALGATRDPRLAPLADDAVLPDAKREVARGFLIRRLTSLQIARKPHTKNMYRREWRQGGMAEHDQPLPAPSVRGRLVVALIQKKVAELLQKPGFNASFQIGMLASFESFFQTAKVATGGDQESSFDQAEQTDVQAEREGIDTQDLNQLAASYRREFEGPMPHPKMDAVVESLGEALARGEKSLVFVRRVKSVPELAEKLCRRYDAWLIARLEALLPTDALRAELDAAVRRYGEGLRQLKPSESDFVVDGLQDEVTTEQDALVSTPVVDDPGGQETFFSWFFRGSRAEPRGYLTGGLFRENRLDKPTAALATFFEDNYVSGLLGDPADVVGALAGAVGKPRDEVASLVRDGAAGLVRRQAGGRLRRRDVFHSFQASALSILARSSEPLSVDAEVVWRIRYGARIPAAGKAPDQFPQADTYLDTLTFFSGLRTRPALRDAIWPERQDTEVSSAERFVDRERRRALLSCVARLGHTLAELWAVEVARAGSMRRSSDAEESDERALVHGFLDLLDRSRETSGLTAWKELSEVGSNHDLILAVNFPDARSKGLLELDQYFSQVVGSQLPVAGIYGGVPKRVVSQFRMPGYPLVLVSTDVLQEGEDLHTFCSRVVHYGIGWTPSSMEQRTGRIDRIGSRSHRELERRTSAPAPADLLQVHYPHLRDTYELVQVQKVFEQMNRFMRLAHLGEGLETSSTIDTREGFAAPPRDIAPIEGLLETAFDVRPGATTAARRKLAVTGQVAKDLLARFETLLTALLQRLPVDWQPRVADRPEARGTYRFDGTARVQPFSLFLRSSSLEGRCVLHVVSPIGQYQADGRAAAELARAQSELGVKLCLAQTARGTYTVSAEADLLFDERHLVHEEVVAFLQRTLAGADAAERSLIGEDQPYEAFKLDLDQEATHAPR